MGFPILYMNPQLMMLFGYVHFAVTEDFSPCVTLHRHVL